MRRIWQMRGLALLLIGGALATFAWGETIELVTYFPTTSQAGDLGLRSLTVGDAIGGVDLEDGELQVQERVGIHVDIGSFDLEDRLVVGGGRDVVSRVLFLPGENTPFGDDPSMHVGIVATDPRPLLEVGGLLRRSQMLLHLVGEGIGNNPNRPRLAIRNITEKGLAGIHISHLSDQAKDDNPLDADGIRSSSIGYKSGSDILRINNSRTFDDAQLSIDPAGNVGFGTERPLTPLHLYGQYVEPGGDATAVNPHHRVSAVFDAMSDRPRGTRTYSTVRGYPPNYTGRLATAVSLAYDGQPAVRLGFYADALNGEITKSMFYINTDPDQVLSWVAPSFVITDTGNVGIGITNPRIPASNPAGNLDVNDVYLRSTSQWVSQLGGGEFKLMRGSVTSTGVITAGSGFTVSRFAVGRYRITFGTRFSSQPSALVSIRVASNLKSRMCKVFDLSTTQVVIYGTNTNRQYRDVDFDFLVIGPR